MLLAIHKYPFQLNLTSFYSKIALHTKKLRQSLHTNIIRLQNSKKKHQNPTKPAYKQVSVHLTKCPYSNWDQYMFYCYWNKKEKFYPHTSLDKTHPHTYTAAKDSLKPFESNEGQPEGAYLLTNYN